MPESEPWPPAEFAVLGDFTAAFIAFIALIGDAFAMVAEQAMAQEPRRAKESKQRLSDRLGQNTME